MLHTSHQCGLWHLASPLCPLTEFIDRLITYGAFWVCCFKFKLKTISVHHSTQVWILMLRADLQHFTGDFSTEKHQTGFYQRKKLIWCVVYSRCFISFTTRSDFSQKHLFGSQPDSNLMAVLSQNRKYLWSRQIRISVVLMWTLPLHLTWNPWKKLLFLENGAEYPINIISHQLFTWRQ